MAECYLKNLKLITLLTCTVDVVGAEATVRLVSNVALKSTIYLRCQAFKTLLACLALKN